MEEMALSTSSSMAWAGGGVVAANGLEQGEAAGVLSSTVSPMQTPEGS